MAAGIYTQTAEGYTPFGVTFLSSFVGYTRIGIRFYSRIESGLHYPFWIDTRLGVNIGGVYTLISPTPPVASPDYGKQAPPNDDALLNLQGNTLALYGIYGEYAIDYVTYHRIDALTSQSYSAGGDSGRGDSGSWEYLGVVYNPYNVDISKLNYVPELRHHHWRSISTQYWSPTPLGLQFYEDVTHLAVVIGFEQRDPRSPYGAPLQATPVVPDPSGADLTISFQAPGSALQLTKAYESGTNQGHKVSRISKWVMPREPFKGLAGKGVFQFKCESSYGGTWDWTRVYIAPEIIVSTSSDADYFYVNLSGSYAYDDDARPLWFDADSDLTGYPSGFSSSSPSPFWTALAEPIGNDTWRFSYEAMGDAGVGARNFINFPTYRLPFLVQLKDEAGLVSAKVAVTPDANRIGLKRAKPLIRPTNVFVKRDNSVLWQHARARGGESRFFAGEIATGDVYASDTEGKSWQKIASAWAGASGAKVLDFCALPFGGACSIARLGTQIVFRASTNGIAWGPLVTLGASTGTGTWTLSSTSGRLGTLLVATNGVDTRFESTGNGKLGTWQSGATPFPFAGISDAKVLDFEMLPFGREAALARLNNNIVFRYNASGQSWGAIETVCPSSSGTWAIISAFAAGNDTLGVTNSTNSRFNRAASQSSIAWVSVPLQS